MTEHSILAYVKSVPFWLMADTGMKTLQHLVEVAGQMNAGLLDELFPAPPGMTVQDKTAIIPVKGILVRNATAFMKRLGFTAYGDVVANALAAEKDKSVSRIVFNTDSPGGEGIGPNEAAVALRGLTKPTIAFTSGLCCSGAYWLASQADEIVSTPTALVGNIGVYSYFDDTTEAFKNAGVKREVFTSGKYKGAGLAGTAMSDAQREQELAQVLELADMFKADVRAARHRVANVTLEGQALWGASAVKAGLVDKLALSLESLLASSPAPSKRASGPRTFAEAVQAKIKSGLTEAAAVGASIAQYPNLHREYLAAGGGSLTPSAPSTPSTPAPAAGEGTFPAVVRELVKSGLTPVQAIEKAIAQNAEAYSLWRQMGGGQIFSEFNPEP